ncbi:MAG TPA: dihydrofolate reductase family protein [Chloroflexota bacterium]|nr:dihydrofolate reductase family protein [Chloroflexota bacterium]
MKDHAHNQPVVTVHYAQSLDGQIATCTGDSRWISSPATLTYAHALRAENQAVLVGVGTIIADDPRLTLRLVRGEQPRRVVLDSALRIPLGSMVLNDSAKASTVLITTPRASAERIVRLCAKGVDVVVVEESDDGKVCLASALECLSSFGIERVLVEGGNQTITSFLRAGLVSRLAICIAPLLIGKGVGAVGDLGVVRLAQAIRFQTAQWIPAGPDLIFEGKL